MSRPDPLSAFLLARATKHRVEIVSLDTADSTTFANPDGTRTSEIHADPIRVATGKDKSGKPTWAPVDTTLVASTDGSWHPKSTTVSESFGGPDGRLVTTKAGAAALGLNWAGTLPKPTASGTS
jgi:hypothetical protein